MFANSKLIKRLAPAMIGVAIASAAYATTDSEEAASGCEIRTTQKGSMISLDGVFVADAAVSGSYTLKITSVSGGGNTNIRQGGGFSAGAGEEVMLGRVMVGGHGASYEASLEVQAGGETLKCSERIGSSI